MMAGCQSFESNVVTAEQEGVSPKRELSRAGLHPAARLVDCVCSINRLHSQRRRVVPQATGTVVEIGIGSGHNLQHYKPDQVDQLIGIDPFAPVEKLEQSASEVPFDFQLRRECAEQILLEDQFADTVVMSYALCSIEAPEKALSEIKRILKPDGRLLFCEHGRHHHGPTARMQDKITPLWSRLTAGCHLNRPVSRLIQKAGFHIDFLENDSLRFVPSVIGYHYIGVACPLVDD